MSKSFDPLDYLHELDFNTKKFPQYSHVIESNPVAGSPEKVVRICRCWQSKKFPYCDDTHKVMVEAGDNVGPYIAKLKPEGGPVVKNVSAAVDATTALRRTSRAAGGVILSVAAGWLAAEGAKQAWKWTKENKPELVSGVASFFTPQALTQ